MVSLFFTTSVIFLLCGSYFHMVVKNKQIYDKISSLILFIASACYALMGLLYIDNPYIMIRGIRYFDWFLTVPLLMYQLYWFLDRNLRHKGDLYRTIGFSILMLTFGLLGEIEILNKFIANIIGTAFYGAIFYTLISKSKKKDLKFFIITASLWLFYPIVYVINESLITLILFSLVDIGVKIGTSFYIRNKKHIPLKRG